MQIRCPSCKRVLVPLGDGTGKNWKPDPEGLLACLICPKGYNRYTREGKPTPEVLARRKNG